MRLLLLVIFLVILGGSLGIARTWSEFSGVEERMELPAAVEVGSGGAIVQATPDVQPADTTGTPRASVVGASSQDFGILEREATRTHSFVIRNDGDADLLVEKQNVSCGLCVETTFTTAVVKPGGEVSIPVTFRARKPGPALNENLEVRTNDAAHEVIRFDLIAYISKAAGASVTELALGSVSTDRGVTATFHIYGFVDQPLEIIDCKLEDRENRDYFEWEVNDLAPEAVQQRQSHAKAGKEFHLTVKPGVPIGPLNQKLTIEARAGDKVEIEVPINGRVTGDLSLMGGSTFTPDSSVLSLGRLLASEGGSAKLMLMVKGEHRDEVQVTVGKCDPSDYLSVTIDERKAIRDGDVFLFPLTVQVPANVPPVNRLGGARTPYATIVLETTHPTIKQVTLYVRFAVE